MEPEEQPRPRFKSHFHDRKDEHCEKVERHISNLSEFLERGSISKKQPPSILKNPSSTTSSQKSSKNYINEYQRTARVPSEQGKQQTIDLSDDEEDLAREKRASAERQLEKDDAKERQLKAAEEDPNCPEGHVPLPNNERLDALKLAQKREKLCDVKLKPLLIDFRSFLGFKELVDDLNRLPMTSETLRVRNRKIEIEKELRGLEINIRVFSRTKVYVKLD